MQHHFFKIHPKFNLQKNFHPHRASAFGSSLAGSSFSAVSGACKTGEGLPSDYQRKQGRKRKKPQLDLSWMCLSPAKNSKVDDDLSPHQQHAQKCLHKFYDELNHVSSAWNYLDIYPWLLSPPVWRFFAFASGLGSSLAGSAISAFSGSWKRQITWCFTRLGFVQQTL